MEKLIVLDSIEINLANLTGGERIAIGTLCEEDRSDLLHTIVSNDRIKKIGVETIPAQWCGIDDPTSCPPPKISFVNEDTLRYTKVTLVEKLSDYLEQGNFVTLKENLQQPIPVYLTDDPKEFIPQDKLPNFVKDGFFESQSKFADRTGYEFGTLNNQREIARGAIWLENGILKTSVGHYCRQVNGKHNSPYEYFVPDDGKKYKLAVNVDRNTPDRGDRG